MNKRALLVGITGGIGAGKSIVARIFTLLGVPFYAADDRAKVLMQTDEALREGIQAAFGREAYTSAGELNRAYLAATVFHDEAATKRLNGLVHPAVGRDFSAWSEAHQAHPYVLKEAALLVESGSYKELDSLILVKSPLVVRINRILARDPQRDLKQINAIIDRQLPDEEKARFAEFIIKNTDQKALIPQVLTVDAQLRKKAAERISL
ncbi:dephospho-CoA kinase [Nitritalea halalkaliphila LW7]|uniref:Dephospho-CoA kinase n=1 Tax=Nitritalea halalkaliphila LW7 TaxID=1189621 RepID=I5CAD1_9BACT|nr:dephospho-CoA kinase [Nitritalea halalkaliphila]EIM78783.1 dephospho-CoA kinase [Nitritalea halalkaliphila LW7]